MLLNNVKTSTMRKMENNMMNVLSDKIYGEYFELTADQLKKQSKINTTKVNDILGMVMTTVSLGDAIGRTIRKAGNFTSVNLDQFIKGENGTLGEEGYEMFVFFFMPLYNKIIEKDGDRIYVDENKLQQLKETTKGRKVSDIYSKENGNVFDLTNKFDMLRKTYYVTNIEYRLFIEQLFNVNVDSTIEDLKTLQYSFGYLTRGLGESTIDIKKHQDRHFYLTIDQIISKNYKVVGGVKYKSNKVKQVTSNIDEVLRNGKVDDYKISFGKFEPSEDNGVLIDSVGQAKITAKETTEETVKKYMKILSATGNLEGWKEYTDTFKLEIYAPLLSVLESAYDQVPKMSKEQKERTLAAIYNFAEAIGIERDDVIKAAIQYSLYYKRGNNLVCVFDDADNNRTQTNKVASLFGDIFVAEYNHTNTLEVEVDFETCIDLEEGMEFEIEDGYGLNGQVLVYGPYQDGKVKVVYDEEEDRGYMVALYNPVETLLAKYPDEELLLVNSYNKTLCSFANWEAATTATEREESFGYTSLSNNTNCRIIAARKGAVTEDNQLVIVLEGENGEILPTAVTEMFIEDEEEKDYYLRNTIVKGNIVVGKKVSKKAWQNIICK